MDQRMVTEGIVF